MFKLHLRGCRENVRVMDGIKDKGFFCLNTGCLFVPAFWDGGMKAWCRGRDAYIAPTWDLFKFMTFVCVSLPLIMQIRDSSAVTEKNGPRRLVGLSLIVTE